MGMKRPAAAACNMGMKRPAAVRQARTRKAVAQSASRDQRQEQLTAVAEPSPHPMILSLVEDARERIETFLGWAMVLRLNVCCRLSVTLVTQHHLAEALQLAWPRPSIAPCIFISRNVLRLFIQRVAPIRGLSNVPPRTLRSLFKVRYRVRVEHITHWSQPLGEPYPASNLRGVFRNRRFAWIACVVDQAVAAGTISKPRCWRHRPSYGYPFSYTTTTVRFAWHGFQVELLEQADFFCDSRTDSESDSSSHR